MAVIPTIFSLGKPIEILVLNPEQARLLEVRHRDAPAAFEIHEQPVGDDVLERCLDVASQAGSRVEVLRDVRELKRGLVDGQPGDVGTTGAVAFGDQCSVQRRTQHGHLDEVVDMSRLQGGILPVVDEREEFAGLGREVGIDHGTQLPDDTAGDDRHG